MKTQYSIFITIIILALSFLALPPVQAADLSVTQGGKEILSFRQTANGFRAASARLQLDVVKSPAGFLLVLGGKEYKMKGKEKGYKIYNPSGALVYKIKEKDAKIKILRSENDPAPWAVKLKGDHYKVASGEREIGKVKFYGDKKKIKVKDTGGAEVCEAAANWLVPAPAVVLFSGLKERDMLILFAALCLVGK